MCYTDIHHGLKVRGVRRTQARGQRIGAKPMTERKHPDVLGETGRWLDIGSAIVLALATMASAWCAYQSALWSGVQTFRLAAVSTAGRDAAAQSMKALELRGLDASMFINYVEARGRGDTSLEDFLYGRFRPEMRKALDAWLKTDPLHNPHAPLTPFQMAEYVQPELLEAQRQQREAEKMEAAARQANQFSDQYVLLTVVFATVLFFGGISGTFRSRRLQLTAFAIAVLLFVVTIVGLGTMPICNE